MELHKITLDDGTVGTLIETVSVKMFKSDNLNWMFRKSDGLHIRFGRDEHTDPDYGVPEICDMEVTTICRGTRNKDGIRKICDHCYKRNTPCGKNMSFDLFKKVFDALPKSITQIAFGADSQAEANPDLFKMMEYCRENGVIPNITVADISEKTAKKLAELCGAVSVSAYPSIDKNRCYDSVKLLTDNGLKVCNIHLFTSEESYDHCLEVLNDVKTDPRLSKILSVIILSLKSKGRALDNGYTPLSQDKFNNIVSIGMENNFIGFDSCSSPKFAEAVKYKPDFKKYMEMVDSCESGLFSVYINSDGKLFPCSFMEGVDGWEDGIDISTCNDFMKDVWWGDRVSEWRKNLIDTKDCNGCRNCPKFKV